MAEVAEQIVRRPRRKQRETWAEVVENYDKPPPPPQPITEQTLRSFINDFCIKRAPKGSQELPSLEGGDNYYEWQFYLRTALLIPQFLWMIGGAFWKIYQPRFAKAPFQLAGVEQASLPVLTALLLFGANMRIPIKGFTIRKERKAYGMRNLIEGVPQPNLPVVIVDDLTSEYHRSLWHALHALALERLRPYPSCFVVVRKQEKDESPIVPTSAGPLTIESMFTLDDFVLPYEDYKRSKK